MIAEVEAGGFCASGLHAFAATCFCRCRWPERDARQNTGNQLKTLAETALVGTSYQLPRKSQFKVWTVDRPKFQLSVPCTVESRMKGVSASIDNN